MGALVVDGLELELVRSARRSLSLQVGPVFGLRLRAPREASEAELRAFVRRKRAWIEKQLARRGGAEALRAGPRYAAGDLFPLWGESLRLDPRPSGRAARARRADGLLVVEAPDPGDGAALRAAIERFYVREARGRFPAIFESCVAGARKLGLGRELRAGPPELRVRSMRSRWGSCNPDRRVVTLAASLAEYPPEAAEFVAYHELAHLRERRHDEAFYDLLGRLCPDWRDRRRLLDGRRPGLPPPPPGGFAI